MLIGECSSTSTSSWAKSDDAPVQGRNAASFTLEMLSVRECAQSLHSTQHAAVPAFCFVALSIEISASAFAFVPLLRSSTTPTCSTN
jgi:hypothetical protein